MSAPPPPVEKSRFDRVVGGRSMVSRVVCGVLWSWVIVSSVALSDIT
jgi:hypothetical protein